MAATRTLAQRLASPWLVAPLCLLGGWSMGHWLPVSATAGAGDGAEGAGLSGSLWRGESNARREVVAMPTLHPIVEKVSPSVVAVEALLASGRVSGSGFVIHEDGLIVTSRHLIQGAEQLLARVPGERLTTAELVGEDSLTDLAVLRLVDVPEGLRSLTIGESEDLRQGDWVVTVGNPHGYTQTVTPGLVSYVGRHLPRHDMRVTGNFIQFSAPVHPGSSGGPVVDMKGHVVGVVAEGATEAQGISFAVPSHTLKWVLDQVQRQPDGLVRRAFLGIQFSSERMDGVMIVRVEPGQPAERAGLRRGDVIETYRGDAVDDAATLHEWVTTSAPGENVALLVRRGSEKLTMNIVLGEAQAEQETEELDR